LLTLRLKILLAALATQRARAITAASMMALGVTSTLLMAALSTGARLEMEAEQDRMGRNLFYVRAAERPVSPGRGNGWFVSSRLKPDQAALIERDVPAVQHAVPVRERSALVKLDANKAVSTVRGVTPEFFELRNFEVEYGRALTHDDGRALRRVAVLGPYVREQLVRERRSGTRSLVGETVRVGGVPFTVVGELRAKGAGTDGSNLDDQILIPFETSVRRFENVESASLLLVQTRDQNGMASAMDGVRRLLRAAHYIEPNARDDFDILETIRQNAARSMNGRFMRGLSRILTAVTLVLGGAGVFAVSYLNVKERTSEIGLRMALGATRMSIAALFLFEACALSLLGGIAGLAIGATGALLLRAAIGWTLAIDAHALMLALAVSAGVGALCSLLPAWRASQLMPARTLAE
jgi:putative ABC transport system permease protein